jgi:hypothetical protein
MLTQEDKILIVHRRLFEKDTPRFFVGEVQAYEAGITKVNGYTFAKDMFSGNIQRKPYSRMKIISIISGTFLVYQLPVAVLLDSVRLDSNQDGTLVLKGDGGFSMDVAESIHKYSTHQ